MPPSGQFDHLVFFNHKLNVVYGAMSGRKHFKHKAKNNYVYIRIAKSFRHFIIIFSLTTIVHLEFFSSCFFGGFQIFMAPKVSKEPTWRYPEVWQEAAFSLVTSVSRGTEAAHRRHSNCPGDGSLWESRTLCHCSDT